MTPRLFIILTLLLFTSVNAAAETEAPPPDQTLDSREAIAEQTREFMEKVARGRTQDAYKSIRPYLGVPVKSFDDSADEATDYFLKAIDRAGNTIGFSKIQAQSIGDDFHQVTWLQKFRAAAIAWTFTFYQPEDGWKLVGVGYSTELETLYQPDN